MRTDYVILCSMIPHWNLQPLIPLGPCGWFPGYSWRLAPIYHQPPWSSGAVPSTLRCGLSHFMVPLRGLNQIVRFGSMVCLLAGPAFYLRQWLHPNCIRTFSTWLSRLNKQLKVAVLTHHFGVLPCSWKLVESFGPSTICLVLNCLESLSRDSRIPQKRSVDPQNTSWGLPVSLTTTSSSCFPRTFRTAGGCWPLTG